MERTKKEKLSGVWEKLTSRFRKEPSPVREIPSINLIRHYAIEEYLQMGLVLLGMGILLLVPQYLPDILISYGWVTGFGAVIWAWMVVAFCMMALIMIRGHFDKRAREKAFEHDCWEGKIREITEYGILSYPFQLWIESVMRLNVSAENYLTLKDEEGNKIFQEKDLKTKDGKWLVSPDLNFYLVTTAYRSDDDLLKRFIVVCDETLSEHERLLTETRTFTPKSIMGVNRTVSELNLVVASRMVDDRPIFYITDSAVVVRRVVNRDGIKRAELPETLLAEAEYGIMAGERYRQKADALQSELHHAEERAVDWELMYHRKKGDELRQSSIMTPEQETKEPFLTTRMKQILIFAGIFAAIAVIGLAYLYLFGYFPLGWYP